MSEAYHNEALRKARVIEKQHDAMERMGVKHTEDCYNYRPVGSGTPYKAPGNYRDAQRPVTVQQGTGYDRIVLPPSATRTSAAVQSGVYRDIKRQEKTLRDHNLIMGPMNAFGDYFDPGNYNPHKSSCTKY